MKNLSYYVALALAAGLWGCNQGQIAQKGEYDDLYFSAKDRDQVLTASASQEPMKYNNQRVEDNQDQQDVNPEYSNQNVQQNRRQSQYDNTQAGDTYYDENYTANQDRRFGNIRPNYNYTNTGGGYVSNYSYYDPFFSDTFYDPYFARSPYYYDNYYSYGPAVIYRPRVTVVVGPSWGWGGYYGGGWGWNRWNRGWGGWNDPWGYSAWNNPYCGYGPWGGYYGNYYGGGNGWYGNGGWNRGDYGNNVIVGNGGRNGDNSIYQNYGRRDSRDRNVISNSNGSTPQRGNIDPNNGGRSRGGRVAQGENTTTVPEGGYTRPARSGSSSQERNPSQITQGDYSRGRTRTNSNPEYNAGSNYPSTTPATRPAEGSVISRPTRPRSSDNPSGDNNTQRTNDYSNRRSSDYSTNNNNSNDSRPSYSTPRNENRSSDSYNNNRSNSNDSYSRPSRSYDSNSNSGSNSGGRSSGSYSGGGSNNSSSGGGRSSGSSSGGSSGGYTRPPR